MTPNMGTLDRTVRVLGALALLGAWYFRVMTGTLGWVALAIAAVLLATSAVGWCPAYLPFGLSTRKKPAA
jgi:hypothetical protein